MWVGIKYDSLSFSGISFDIPLVVSISPDCYELVQLVTWLHDRNMLANLENMKISGLRDCVSVSSIFFCRGSEDYNSEHHNGTVGRRGSFRRYLARD